MGLFRSSVLAFCVLMAGQIQASSPQSRLYWAPRPLPSSAGNQFGMVPVSCLLFKVMCPPGYTGPGGSPSPAGGSSTPPQDLSQQVQAALTNGNSYRSAHGAPPMTLDPTLTAEAQKYAEEMARTGSFKHSDPKGMYGENLALSTGSSFTIAQANDAWYGEKPLYCPAQAGITSANGHFTQMVWKSSTSVGYGSAKGADGKTYIVARYSPPGNYNDPAMLAANVQC